MADWRRVKPKPAGMAILEITSANLNDMVMGDVVFVGRR